MAQIQMAHIEFHWSPVRIPHLIYAGIEGHPGIVTCYYIGW